MILLTGTTGYIGSHLLDGLIEIYGSDQIVALTSIPINKCRYLLHNGYNFNKQLFIQEGLANIDTIIHAGAFTPKKSVEGDDILKCNSNILSSTTLLFTDLPEIKNFIFLSAIDVYGDDNPITEKSLINPVSLYAYSKLYCEKLVSVWATKNKISHQILRIGHVYGPGEEKYHKIIPVTMQQILKGDAIQLFGEGKDIRSFIYISDAVQSIINAIKLKNYSGVINIVGNEKITIFELVNKIITIADKPTIIENVKTSSKKRDWIFDNHKMAELLHKPKVKIDEGLRHEWDYMEKLEK
jgi:UDP-glucose 4-epimerase